MNIQLQYGTAVATVPAAALAVLDRATQDDLKVLLNLCAKPALMTGNSFGECVGNIAAEVGCTPARVEASLSFWRGAGVLNMRDEESVTPPKGTEVKVTASPEVPEEVAAALDLPPTCLAEFRCGAFPVGELQQRIADHLGVPAASLADNEPIEPPCRISAHK